MTQCASVLRALAGRDRGSAVAATRARPTRGIRVGVGLTAAASRDAAPPSRTRRERRDAHRDARHAKLAGPDGGSRVSPAAATLGLSRETVRLAGGVHRVVDRAVELASGRDETGLEVALGLATDAMRVAAENARRAARVLEERSACVADEAGGSSRGGTCEDAPEGGDQSPSFEDLEDAFQDASLAAARANDVFHDIQGRLSERLIVDEWCSIIASVAATDFRRDRKRPRVRARDRRCNQPKPRQGWDKKKMRAFRVRVCAGCDRMLPAAELIRVVRLTRAEDEKKDEGEETNATTDLSSSSRETEKKTGSRKKKSQETRVVAVDVSSFLGTEGASTLAASVAPGGAFAAATEEHPDASRAAAELAETRRRDDEETATEDEDEDEDASREAFSRSSPRERRLPRRLPGRATYVCRRGVCARRVAKAKTLKRHLRVSPGVGDRNRTQKFHDALVGVCDLAERLERVDSACWAFEREPGTPSRWEAHPVVFDVRDGREVASERAKRLAVGGSGEDADEPEPEASA